MMNKETKLLSCPFCGGESKHIPEDACIDCSKCMASIYYGQLPPEEGVKMWNTRAITVAGFTRVINFNEESD